MTVRIVDRRFDSKNRSSVNRARFIRRYKAQVRAAVNSAIDKRAVREVDSGGRIGIAGRDISEPQFGIGRGGQRDMVHPGNDRFLSGDQIERPAGGSGAGGAGPGGASRDGEGLDEFAFTLSREEFLDIFFDELALPNLVKRQLAQVDEYRKVRAGYTHTGVPTNISLVRTMRGAAGRRIATGGPHATRLAELEAALQTLLAGRAEDDPEVEALRREIAALRLRLEQIPFIDSFDLRYTNRIRVPQPSTRAVMFCLMDVSGSMDENRKNIAKRFFMLLYLFLTRNYRHVDVVFIRHHTVAAEVDENDFFHARESGGTVVSSALALMLDIVRKRYPGDLWNVYAAQASDGDNFDEDSPRCRELLENTLLARCQYFAYIEIDNKDPHSLWREYEKLAGAAPGRFALQRIATVADIYPVFRELFRQRA